MDTPRTAEQTYGSKEKKMSATQMAHEIMSGGEHSKARITPETGGKTF